MYLLMMIARIVIGFVVAIPVIIETTWLLYGYGSAVIGSCAMLSVIDVIAIGNIVVLLLVKYDYCC